MMLSLVGDNFGVHGLCLQVIFPGCARIPTINSSHRYRNLVNLDEAPKLQTEILFAVSLDGSADPNFLPVLSDVNKIIVRISINWP